MIGRQEAGPSHLRIFLLVLSVLLLSAMRAAPTFMNPGCRSAPSSATFNMNVAAHRRHIPQHVESRDAQSQESSRDKGAGVEAEYAKLMAQRAMHAEPVISFTTI